MKHKLLCAVSVLPALLIMPAMADIYTVYDDTAVNLNALYASGDLRDGLKLNGKGYNKDIDLSLTGDTIKFETNGRSVQSYQNAVLHLGDEDTKSITLSANEDIALIVNNVVASGDLTNNHNGGKIVVTAQEVDISTKGTNVGYNNAVHVANGTTATAKEKAQIDIVADTVNITADSAVGHALSVMSEGILNITGNATISGKDALVTRGDAQTSINVDGLHTTVMNGDVNFSYYGPNSGTKINADVNIVLAGESSKWTGNSIVSYEYTDGKKPTADKFVVDDFTLDLRDGATWNATQVVDTQEVAEGKTVKGEYYTALNNLQINSGTDGDKNKTVKVNVMDTTRGITVDKTLDVTNAAFAGGHLVVASTVNGASITNSKFTNLDNQEITVRDGGAIVAQSDLTLTNNVFNGNASTYSGGAIKSGTNAGVTVNGGSFANNNSFIGGAISDGYNAAKDLTIKIGLDDDGNATVFRNNHATADGGAIALYKVAEITGAKFIGNTAGLDVKGFGDGDSTSDGGGALIIGGTATAKLTDVTFAGNQSAVRGGAISGRHTAATEYLVVDGGLFNGNQSGNFGGGIANVYSGIVSLKNDVKFTGNTAQKAGGAIYNGVDKNYGVVGGVMSTDHGTINIDTVTFSKNSAGEKGGAIFNDEGGTLNLSGTNVFTGNTAAGARNDIYNAGTLTIASGKTTIDGGIMSDADRKTGTFILSAGAELDMGATTISQHTLQLDGTIYAKLNDSKDFAHLLGDVTFGGAAELNLDVATVGTYKIFADNTNILSNIVVNDLFTVDTNDAKGQVIIATRDAADIAEDKGLSLSAAETLTALASSSNKNIAMASQNALQALADGNTEYIETETAKLAPETRPVAQSLASSMQNQVVTLASARMAGVATGRSGGDVVSTGAGMWAHALFNKSKYNGQFKGYSRGMAVGVDSNLNRKYTVGVGYANSDSDIHTENGRNADVESNTVFLYTQYKPSDWFANATVNYTVSKYSESDNVFGADIKRDHDVKSFGAQLMTGYNISSGFTPELGARYLHVAQDGYFNGISNVADMESDYLSGVAGLRYAFDINANRALVLRPEMRAAATYDVLSSDKMATVTFPKTAGYVVDTSRLSRMGGEFGVSLSMLYKAWEISANYDLDLHENYTSQTGMIKVRYNF